MTNNDRVNSEQPEPVAMMELPPPRAPMSRGAVIKIVLAAIVIVAVLLALRPHFQKLEIYAQVDGLQFSDPILKDCVRRTARENGWSDAGHFVALRCNNPSGEGIKNLAGLQHLVRLKDLDLAFNELSDVSVLASLPHLVSLELSHNKIVALPLMRSSISIRRLDVNFNRMRSVQWLGEQHFAFLEVLSLAHNEIDHISATTELPMLYELNLRNNHLASIGAILPLGNLVMLDVGGNQIHDISGIGALLRLRRLFVDRNALTSLDGLQFLHDLDELDVSHNALQSATSLSGLVQLQRLNINQTGMHDLNDLLALGDIEILRALGNPELSCESIENAVREFGAAAVITDTRCSADTDVH